ncbi:hypothetical protein GS896_27575 [Rhodococcus hoagii]|nr:hypothetical protein [Prescottella equi]MBM4654013.1 hypothetical protein [Prescottella equi]NKR23521.1 hypothetical protein [Prescottella equi]NKT56325.1 hypothetical protein [Prescottella equi]NKU37514.1 hypothetical protein [Prescottella equi]
MTGIPLTDSAIEFARSLAVANGFALTDAQAREAAEIGAADLQASERMEEMFLAGKLSSQTIAALASDVWKSKPDQNVVRHDLWREMFTIAGYTHDHRRARRPLLGQTLYRGASECNREGLSWTTLPSVAEHFADYRQRTGRGVVWIAKIPAKRLLAAYSDEREYVVDARGLEMRVVPDEELRRHRHHGKWS